MNLQGWFTVSHTCFGIRGLTIWNSPHHDREKEAEFTAGTATFLIPKLNEADLSFILWAEQNTCREMGKKTNISFWWWSGAAGQKRCVCPPLCSVCNTWLSSHWLLLATALWIFTGSLELTLGTTYNPHSQEVEHCSMSDSPVQEWQGWAELGARQGDEGRTSGNSHNQLQSSVVQAKPKEQGRPEVKLGTRAKPRYHTHFTQFKPALREGSQLYAASGWLEQWELAGVLQFLTAIVRGSLGTVLALNWLSTSNT